MSSMAPDYNAYNQMRGTYAYLTIGDYIYQQPGVFTQMNISNLLDAPWEIALDEPEYRGPNNTNPIKKQMDQFYNYGIKEKLIDPFSREGDFFERMLIPKKVSKWERFKKVMSGGSFGGFDPMKDNLPGSALDRKSVV